MTASRALAYRQRLFRTHASDSLPITLRHQRIYILPTRLGLAMAAVVLLMLVASINYRLSLGYALSFILTGLFASCLLNAYRNLNGVVLGSITAEDCFAPHPLRFDVELTARDSRRRYSIEIADAAGGDVVDIAPNATARAMLISDATTRGQHSLGRLTLSSTFPLGLWRGWAYVHAPASGYVYPAPETPAPALPTAASSSGKQPDTGSRNNARPAQSGEYDSLRNWQRTDSPASVAWKAVARGNGWYSKDFTSSSADESLLLQWDDIPTNMPLEQRLSRFCAWVIEAQSRSTICQVIAPGIGATLLQRGQAAPLLRHLATMDIQAESTP
jgi:uncharacterized protein (DUF58 family)